MKSEISLVHEIALKRNLPVSFEVSFMESSFTGSNCTAVSVSGQFRVLCVLKVMYVIKWVVKK